MINMYKFDKNYFNYKLILMTELIKKLPKNIRRYCFTFVSKLQFPNYVPHFKCLDNFLDRDECEKRGEKGWEFYSFHWKELFLGDIYEFSEYEIFNVFE